MDFKKYEQEVLEQLKAYRPHRVQINFSGGKDSTALVATFISLYAQGLVEDEDWERIEVYHSDTTIESPLFYETTKVLLELIRSYGLKVTVGTAEAEKRFFATLIGIGRPVPSHNVRWCTDNLKIRLAQRKGIKVIVTGEHIGESSKRDQKIKKGGCGTNECGQDKASKLGENVWRPIGKWESCDVWEYLAYSDDIFPVYNLLAKVYDIANDRDTNKSLRMGCIGCPVISIKHHYNTERLGVPNRLSIKLSLIYEEMRNPNLRVLNPRKLYTEDKKYLGATALEARKYYWAQAIKPINDEFRDAGIILIGEEETRFIEKALIDGRYPKTYHKDPNLIPKLEAEWETRKPGWL